MMSLRDRAQQRSETTVLPFPSSYAPSEPVVAFHAHQEADAAQRLRDACQNRNDAKEEALLFTAATTFLAGCGAAMILPGYEPIVTHQQHVQPDINLLIGSGSLIAGTILGVWEAGPKWLEFVKHSANVTGHKRAAAERQERLADTDRHPEIAVNTPMRRAPNSTLDLHS